MINIFICCTLTVEIAIIFLCFNTFFPPRSNPFSLAYNPAVCHATPHTFPPWARLSYEPQYYFATDEVTLCGKYVAAGAQRRCSQTKATYYASFYRFLRPPCFFCISYNISLRCRKNGCQKIKWHKCNISLLCCLFRDTRRNCTDTTPLAFQLFTYLQRRKVENWIRLAASHKIAGGL